MKKLLNTLYVTTPSFFIGISGESIILKEKDKVMYRIPLHNLESIIIFSYSGFSSKLLRKCMEYGISISVLSSNGQIYGRFQAPSKGNILLRKKQAEIAMSEEKSLEIAKNMILAKVTNSRNQLMRFRNQYKIRIDPVPLNHSIDLLKKEKNSILATTSKDELRGIEGRAQADYFSVFDELILNDSVFFNFNKRSRRPPCNAVNALLSYAYSLLTCECASALESVGLDAYMGFNHVDRPGRASLALDLVEEFRSVIADRIVLKMINLGQFKENDFILQGSGAVLLNDSSRKKFLSIWQQEKQNKLSHPFLDEKIEWGLLPYVQALLLNRHLRGDLSQYPPFFWR